jgi:hypothetical protein
MTALNHIYAATPLGRTMYAVVRVNSRHDEINVVVGLFSERPAAERDARFLRGDNPDNDYVVEAVQLKHV